MSFEEFASSQVQPLLRLATALSGDAATAQDLVQDVLIKTHANWSKVESARSSEHYVRRMLINEHVSWRRKWARLIPAGLGPDDGRRVLDPSVAYADRDEMVRLLARLPAKQRAVLALRYMCALSDSEIADVLDCSAGTVRAYASRAIAALKASGADELGKGTWIR